jgi:hypothetical protein
MKILVMENGQTIQFDPLIDLPFHPEKNFTEYLLNKP